MIKVLLLSAGTNACYHVAKILKEKFNKFYIIGADINDDFLIPSFYFLDSFYKVPGSDHNDYYQTILKICKNEKVDYILPSFDIDQKLFYPENKDLFDLNVKSLSTPKDTLSIYEDKEIMNNYLKNNNILVPKTYSVEEVNTTDIYFIKPKNGVGSIGARKIQGSEILKQDNKNYIIQEMCQEPEFTLECFYYQNKLSSAARERIVSKSGVCTKAKVFTDSQLEKIANDFIKILKVPLFFNLQFMKNSNNDYVVTDVNLRLAGGMSLSYAAGWDEVSALADILLGKNKNEIFKRFNLSSKTQYVVRAYTDIVTKKLEK